MYADGYTLYTVFDIKRLQPLPYGGSRLHGAISHAGGDTYLQRMLSEMRQLFGGCRKITLALPGSRDEGHVGRRKLLRALCEHGQGCLVKPSRPPRLDASSEGGAS
jgi:hypothetical protein